MNDEKQILVGEQNFVKQVQQSLAAVNELIKNTREQFQVDLATTQTLFTENSKSKNRSKVIDLKGLSETIELLKENTGTKFEILDNTDKELASKIYDTQQMFHALEERLLETFEKEVKKVKDQNKTFEEGVNAKLQENDENVYILRESC